MTAEVNIRYLRTGDRKLGIVLKLIRGKKVEESLQILRFCERNAARMIEKALKSAIANANQGEARLNLDKARISECTATLGGVLANARRFSPRAMGRAAQMRKRTSHLKIVVSDEATKAKK